MPHIHLMYPAKTSKANFFVKIGIDFFHWQFFSLDFYENAPKISLVYPTLGLPLWYKVLFPSGVKSFFKQTHPMNRSTEDQGSP